MSEEPRIRSAAVIGAGVMGATISAHLANAGIPNLLLDIKPSKLTDEEKRAGLTLDDPPVANRLALAGLKGAMQAKPAAFYSMRFAKMVTVGNLEDDLPKLKEADWIIEAIIEDLPIKKSLFEKIAPHVAPHAILSTNTSGLSIAALAESVPEEIRPRFLVTHFFNPPRYLKLLELVASPYTEPGILEGMALFGRNKLGKGIVYGKDTANFVANRIGAYAMFHALHLMLEQNLSVAAVDKLTGKAIGRPKSATFRTADLVGLDTLIHVARNMHDNLPDDPERELFEPPQFVEAMIEKGWLGQKSGQGFYKKVVTDEGKSIRMIDPESLEYVEQSKVKFPSLEMAKNIEDVADRIKSLVLAKDGAGEFLWMNLSATLRYAGNAIPEVSDDIVNVDNALRWGFGWELGPFQVWDAIGVEKSCARMEKEGHLIPAIARDLLASGKTSFYERSEGKTSYFDTQSRAHVPEISDPKQIVLANRKEAGHVVLESPDAVLIDLGDEVVCLEFRTKMNTIGTGVIDMLHKSVDLVEKDWRGLVIGNNGENFCVGANLLMILNELDDDNWDDVDWIISRFQSANQRLRYSERPVVVAPHALTLGGGCELALGGDRVCAAAETYIGLVEVGAGVIPAGGGCKEFIRRIHESIPEGTQTDLFPLVRRVFETVGMARVATSGWEAKDLGFFAYHDRVVIHGDHVISEAKNMVLGMDLAGYAPGRPSEEIRVVGEPGFAALRAGLHNFAAAGQITEHDKVVGGKLASILCGGAISASSRVSEQYLLDLEREAFLSLLGEPKTLDRMEHILKTGKPLRN